MTRTVVRRPPPPALNVRASDVLADYEHWLETVYGSQGTYRHHAKSFLKRCRTGGQVLTQLDTFARRKSITGRSILNRFRRFLLEKNIVSVQNDLNVKALPLGNIYVKLFLLLNGDRIKSRVSKSTYATVLNGYFERIGELRHFQKVTAEGYVFQKGFSDFTSGLYASVLRSFAKWALSYLSTPNRELSAEERKIKDGLKRISQRSLRDVASIKATVEQRKLYHKESLSRSERDRLLKTCANRSERAMVALMAWNGLRPVEVTRLAAVDIDLRARTIAIQGKGRSRSKTTIVLFKVTVQELKLYLRDNKSLKDKLFPA